MKKQIVFLTLALCLFVAAEMQGLPQDPAVTVYVSGPTAHTIYKTTWGEACSAGVLAGEVYSNGSQFRPTGIEYGSDNLIYFADNSHSEIGRVSLDGQQFEIISDSSISTLENPTDIIFTATDAIVSSRAGSNKSDAGLYIIRNIAGLPFGDPTIPLPELLSAFGSGGGSSAESFAVLFNRNLIGTEASDDEVLEFEFNNPEFPYTDFTSIFATGGVPMGIAGTGVGDQEVIYVGFPKTGEIFKYDRSVAGGNPVQFAVLPDRYKPRHIETDLAGNLYVAASKQSSGSNGALFCIPPDFSGGTPTDDPVALDSAYGVAVGAGGSVTAAGISFPAGTENGYKLCGDEIILEIPGKTSITATLTCQDITPAEFKAQLDPTVFPLDGDGNQPVECIPEPGKKSCTLITVEGINEPELVTRFIRTMVPFVDFTLASTDVGILYRPTDDNTGDPIGLFSENILRQLEIVDWGFDPGRLTGSKDNFGSEVVFCTSCNTAPDVEAGDNFSVPYQGDVNLDGTVEDFNLIIDNYINPGDEVELLTVYWELTSGPSTGDPFETTFDLETGAATTTVSGLTPGEYLFTLNAMDLAGMAGDDTVTVTVEDPPDMTPPIISSVTANPTVMWPPNHEFWPITISVTATDDFDVPVCRVVSVTHSEAIDGNGDGSTDPDWDFTSTMADEFQEGPLTVLMRSERAEAGSGRYYSVTVECSDSTGNVTDPYDAPRIVSVKDNNGGS